MTGLASRPGLPVCTERFGAVPHPVDFRRVAVARYRGGSGGATTGCATVHPVSSPPKTLSRIAGEGTVRAGAAVPDGSASTLINIAPMMKHSAV
jgi:hypothetical protein